MPSPATLDIALLLYPGCMPAGLFAAADLLTAAALRSGARGWRVHWVGLKRGPVPCAHGMALRADRITDVQVTANATDPTSLDYQERFADAVPDVVVGRPIDEVHVSRLAGSSGTPDGFNEAIEKIKDQASR